MMEKISSKENTRLDKFQKILVVFCSFLLFTFIIFFIYSYAYSKRIYPHIKIADISVGGLTKEEATNLIKTKTEFVNDKNFSINYQNLSWDISPKDLEIHYDPTKSVEAAYNIGHEDAWVKKILSSLKILYKPVNFQVVFQYNKSLYNDFTNGLIAITNQQEQDATLYMENGKVLVKEEKVGKKLEVEQLRNTMVAIIGKLKNDRRVDLPVTILNPKITSSQVLTAQKEAEKMISKEIILTFENQKINLEQKNIIDWLEFVAKKLESQPNYILGINLNQQKIKGYVSGLAQNINQEPEDAKLTIAGGKAIAFQKSRIGYILDQDQTVKKIVDSLMSSPNIAGVYSNQGNSSSDEANEQTLSITLPVQIKKPDITEDGIENLGIKELIASATTNFKSSPENRKYNIKVGANMFHGVMVKPGEEFSFLKYLGDVSEARGYKKELVIKEDATIPEIGGGLCQVSTTMFRVAVNAGLKITERSNHRYRVSYYEPPIGLDATIYDPAPDLKFINDTPGYILIQSSISGTKLTFDFYGTRDGREIYISSSELYDYVNPPEPKYIDDPSLAPGETKYKEKAHQGLKAKVNYVVKRDGKEINKQTFYSKYVAWGAVILRGPVAPPSADIVPSQPQEQPTTVPEQPTPTPTATPTPTVIPTATPTETPSPTPSPTST